MTNAAATRKVNLELVQQVWMPYTTQFTQLNPHVQAQWLAGQGYARFADVLAHIIAWWEVAYDRIERLATGQDAPMVQYDVDAFNLEAVRRFAGLDEAEVSRRYSDWCRRWQQLLERLPDQALENPDIARQLQMDLFEHLNDHALPQR
jgi:hypothetical protein